MPITCVNNSLSLFVIGTPLTTRRKNNQGGFMISIKNKYHTCLYHTHLKIFLFYLPLILFAGCTALQSSTANKIKGISSHHCSSYTPERIILNLTATPFKSQAVTWRTSNRVKLPKAQITTLTDHCVNLKKDMRTITALSQKVNIRKDKSVYHYSVIFNNLKPDTIYTYRVGAAGNFSEWNQFKTASKKHKPFKFIYLGDPQNQIKSMCSQIFRAAYKKAPTAAFWLFAGDLVNNGDNDEEWDELFYGFGFIPRMTPMILLPGNHEYPDKRYIHGKDLKLSYLWRPHFTLPENGPAGLEESVYFIDFQEVRFVMLNGNEKLEEQSVWLNKILSENPQKWTIVAIHQPVYSTAKFRKNPKIKNLLSPVFDKYLVDLVLQGHEHSYSRTFKINNGTRVKKDEKGIIYVISVCGPKFYSIRTNTEKLMAKAESGRQLFQVIHIDHGNLLFEAFDLRGDLYDSFQLKK